jgi:hypothetical protein
MAGDSVICTTCGAFYPADPAPQGCRICLDERQYVGHDGQSWTTPDALREGHSARIEQVEPGLTGIGVEPGFAIGQRALLVDRLLWDCIPLVDDAIVAAVAGHGGLDAIAISHPHYYTGMAWLADVLDCRVLLHEADQEWITQPSPRIELWSGDELTLGPTLTLHRLGGHFEGATVCHWTGAPGGVLLTGDVIQVVQDRRWVSFMRSYPNLIPLPAATVSGIAEHVAPLQFDRLYGAWWWAIVDGDANAKVQRSALRYIAAGSPTAD